MKLTECGQTTRYMCAVHVPVAEYIGPYVWSTCLCVYISCVPSNGTINTFSSIPLIRLVGEIS